MTIILCINSATNGGARRRPAFWGILNKEIMDSMRSGGIMMIDCWFGNNLFCINWILDKIHANNL